MNDRLRSLVLRASVAGPISAVADVTGSPVVAGVAAAAALAIDDLINEGWKRRHDRAATALELAASLRDLDSSEFAAHVVSDDHVMELAMIVLDAATRSTDEAHFWMLAQLLAEGAFKEDSADIDEVAYVAKAVSGLTSSHLRVLRIVAAQTNPGVIRYDEMTRSIKNVTIAEPIRIDLLNLGLVMSYRADELSQQTKAAINFPHNTPGHVVFGSTTFGREVCRRLDEAAEQIRRGGGSDDHNARS